MTSLLKVSTNIITSITTRYIRLAAILMSVSTFKTDIIIYLCCHIQKLKCEFWLTAPMTIVSKEVKLIIVFITSK